MVKNSRHSSGGGSSSKKKSATKSGRSTQTKPKRIRRKCSAPDCTNRVVQGGVCVTHGAKRKLCSYHNCNKAVKLAGFCSTHGPARKKCDDPGCSRVAVQAGKCLGHGARRKVCDYAVVSGGKGKCNKNAIMGGMCKKHYDRVQEAEGMLEMSLCVPVTSSSGSYKKSGMRSVASSSSGSSVGESDSELDAASHPSTTTWSNAAVSSVAHVPSYTTSRDVSHHYPPQAAQTPYTTLTSSHGMSEGYYNRPSKKVKKQGHQRGLSIFGEMDTVDAIIGTSTDNQQQPQQEVASYAQPCEAQQPQPAQVSSSTTSYKSYKRQDSLSTKTPAAQVSFADTTVASRKPGRSPKQTCAGDASCICDACRSPTLAIFEQMIQASQKIDSEEVDTVKYVGLSAPKLSPRKAAKGERPKMETTAGGTVKSPSPKNVSFLPEEPSSSGSVVRKVSINSMVGQSVVSRYPPPPSYQVARQHVAHADYGGPEGPASHALVAMAASPNSETGRTVSYDSADGRKRHHHRQPYTYHHSHAHPPPPAAHHYYDPQAPPQQHYHYPTHGYPAQQRVHTHGSGYTTHHGECPPSLQHAPEPPSHKKHAQHPAQEHFQPPSTPSLYDSKSYEQQEEESSAAVVSSHSHHQDQQLLPKRREAIDHLFIPKEV